MTKINLKYIVKTLSPAFMQNQLYVYRSTLSKVFFKGFLHYARTICLKNIYINQEVQFIIDIFVKNGLSKSFLQSSVCEYQNMKKKNNKNNSFENIKKLR